MDARALRIARLLQDHPSDPRGLREIARWAGASERTIQRVFVAETGLTFGKWRQQLRLIHSLRLLAEGQKVTAVALDVGYESLSAFVSVFRRTFGVTPGPLAVMRYCSPVPGPRLAVVPGGCR